MAFFFALGAKISAIQYIPRLGWQAFVPVLGLPQNALVTVSETSSIRLAL